MSELKNILKPKFITFTGVDDRTNLSDLTYLSNKYPVEFAVLVGMNSDARYPSLQTIKEFCFKVKCKKSIHICGQIARLLQLNDASLLEHKYNGLIELITTDFNRMQINGAFHSHIDNIQAVRDNFSIDLILQTKGCFHENYCFSELYDCSGGNGIVPDKYPKSIKNGSNIVGYAGGISPDNVLDALTKINSDHDYWIDMETGVRSRGWFDIEKVESVCAKVYS